MGTPPGVNTVGSMRRLQALATIGYAIPDVAPYVYCAPRTVLSPIRTGNYRNSRTKRPYAISPQLHQEIVDFYEVHYTRPLNGQKADRMRGWAANRGWYGPQAWEGVDMDDPSALPVLVEPPPSRFTPIDLNELDWLLSTGVSLEDAAQRMGKSVKGIQKALSRQRQRSAA